MVSIVSELILVISFDNRAQPRGRKHRYEDDEDAYQARGRNRRGGRVRRAVESDEDSDDFDDEDDLEYMPSSRKLRVCSN